jgi:hypothetical protein
MSILALNDAIFTGNIDITTRCIRNLFIINTLNINIKSNISTPASQHTRRPTRRPTRRHTSPSTSPKSRDEGEHSSQSTVGDNTRRGAGESLNIPDDVHIVMHNV